MTTFTDFSPLDRSILKLASDRAAVAFKAAKNACKKAYLTQGESEAHTSEGYAEEAAKFLDNGEAIARESAGEDATEEERREIVQLSHGHRAALRTGLFILIKESQGIVDDQEEMFADTSAQRDREKDFRRLEQRLRDQTQMDLQDDASKPTAEAPAAVDDTPPDEPDASGPFDAPPAAERLALSAGESPYADGTHDDAHEDIPDAQIEPVDGLAADSTPVIEDASEDFTLATDEDEEEDESEDASVDVAADSATEAWLNEPLRTNPSDADAPTVAE